MVLSWSPSVSVLCHASVTKCQAGRAAEGNLHEKSVALRRKQIGALDLHVLRLVQGLNVQLSGQPLESALPML